MALSYNCPHCLRSFEEWKTWTDAVVNSICQHCLATKVAKQCKTDGIDLVSSITEDTIRRLRDTVSTVLGFNELGEVSP